MIDPVLIRIGPLSITWYALSYVISLLIGISLIKKLSRKYSIFKMTLIDIAIVSKLAFYKDNLFTKLSLLFDSKYRYKSMESNLFYFLKIILGGGITSHINYSGANQIYV